MDRKERTAKQIEEACSLGAFASFVLEMLLLYEWDDSFREKMKQFQDDENGISQRVLADMWETDADFSIPEMRFIAEKRSYDGGRSYFYRIKSLVYRWIEGMERDWESLSEYLTIRSQEEISDVEEPDELVYPDMIQICEKFKSAFTDADEMSVVPVQQNAEMETFVVSKGKSNQKSAFVMINLWGRRGSGRLENFKCFCRERKQGMLLLDGNTLAEKSKEEQKELLEQGLFVSLLEGCETAIRWIGADEEGCLETLIYRCKQVYWGNGKEFKFDF